MGRSLQIQSTEFERVKLALKQQGYARQQDLAEELQLSRSTLSNYLNGRPVDQLNFMEISDALQLDWQAIADLTADLSSDLSDAVVLAGVNEPEEFEPFVYVERDGVDAIALAVLQQPHALLRIKAPRLMGKTALSYRLLNQLQRQGFATASLNFHLASAPEFTSLSALLKWFCSAVTQLLQRPNQLAKYWDETFSTAKMSATDYVEQYLLSALTSPLVLCLDEVDRLFPYGEVAAEFLGLLRAWHERGKIHPVWQKFRLVLIYGTEVYIPLDLYESPFNVGQFMELPSLTELQVQELAFRSDLNWSTDERSAVMRCLGGHPAYLQRTLEACRSGQVLETILRLAPTEAGIFGDELRHLWRMLERQPKLLDALQQVLTSTTAKVLPPDAAQQLYRLGLISMKGNESTIRCELYRDYFRHRFGDF